MRVLRALGLDAAVERAGARLRRWSFCNQAGEVLLENDLEALWQDIGPCIGIERMRLQQISSPASKVFRAGKACRSDR